MSQIQVFNIIFIILKIKKYPRQLPLWTWGQYITRYTKLSFRVPILAEINTTFLSKIM